MFKAFKQSKIDDSLPILLGLLTLSLTLTRVIYFYFSKDSTRVGVVPDDAFYYIQLAQHRIHDGIWSFDGQTAATGFHFLYEYFLIFIYTLFNHISWTQLYLVVGVFASVFISLSAYYSTKIAGHLFGPICSLYAMIPFLTVTVLLQSSMMMESWLVIFFSAFTLYCLFSGDQLTRIEEFKLIAIGFLGSLSRSDYGLFPGLLFLTCFLSFRLWKNQEVRRSFLILTGAILGVCFVFLQTYASAGHLTQASAQIKLYWSSLQEHNIQIAWQFLKSIIIPFGVDTYISNKTWFIVGLTFFLTMVLVREYIKENLSHFVIGIASLATLCTYTLFYRYNSSALQIWYSANYIVPFSMLLGTLGALLHQSVKVIPVIRYASIIPIIYAMNLYVNPALEQLLFIPWPHQAGMMYAGLFIKNMKLDATFAAWNAGIISYFSGLNVINLDGLVNDELFLYIKNNQLAHYINVRHIDYIADYEFMLKNSFHKIRGGYSDDTLYHCLKSLKAIDGPAPLWPPSSEQSKLQLYEVIPHCLV